MLRIEQAVWKDKSRVIIALEGFDASGKGGLIRRLVASLDPRGVIVHPIAAPSAEEQGKHWLYRFWRRLPKAGTIAVFDRTWYGRVLVERVEGLAKKDEWRRAYDEINEFERMLADDGVQIIKIFLGMSKDEQLKRFEERLKDPYKQWKLTADDLRNRKKWDAYVEAVDEMFEETDKKRAQWHLVPADDKKYARLTGLEIIAETLHGSIEAFEDSVKKHTAQSIKQALKDLGVDDV